MKPFLIHFGHYNKSASKLRSQKRSASDDESIWFDYNGNGALAIERAFALLNLYRPFIIGELNQLNYTGGMSERLVRTLHEKFHISFK